MMPNVGAEDLLEEAACLYQEDRLPEALESYWAALSIYLSSRRPGGQWSSQQLIAVERLADLSALAGAFEAADALLYGLASMLASHRGAAGYDFVEIKRAQVLFGGDRLWDSYQVLRNLPELTSLEDVEVSPDGLRRWDHELWPGTSERVREALLTRLYLLLGRIQAANGRYREAKSCLLRGRELAQEGEEAVGALDYAYSSAFAGVCLEAGRIEEGGSWLETAGARLGKLASAELVSHLSLQGRWHLLAGRYGEAMKALEDAVSVGDRMAFARPAAMTRLNLAQVLVLLNQVRPARCLVEEVRRINADDHDLEKRCGLILALAKARVHGLAVESELPSVSTMLDRRSRQPKSTNLAISEFGREPDLESEPPSSFLSFFEEHALAVRWALHRQQLGEAEERMDRLRAVFADSESRLISARLGALEGAIRFATGGIAEAERVLSQAAEQLRGTGVFPDLWQIEKLLLRCGEASGRSQAELRPLRERVHDRLDGFSASLDQADRRVYLSNKWNDREELLLTILRTVTDLRRHATAASWWRRPLLRFAFARKLSRFLSVLEAGIGHREGGIVEASRTSPSLWRRLLWRSPREVEVTFVVLPDRVVKIRQAFLSLGLGVTPVARQALRDWVDDWYSGLKLLVNSRDLEAADRREVEEEAKRSLGEANLGLNRIFETGHLLGSLPSFVTRLVVRPDDVLRAFPLASLEIEGRPLPERFSLSLAARGKSPTTFAARLDSCRELLGLQHRKPRSRRPKALLIGVPEGAVGFRRLDFVGRELEEVSMQLAGIGFEVESLSSKVTKEHILERLTSVDLFHIACHGRFEPDQPGRSGLILVPQPGEVEILELHELAGLDLVRLRHATFSSCWAGDSLILPGNESIGLPGALLAAGTESVLACLWPVVDRLGATFMASFYSHLAKFDRGEALRRAQQDCIRGGRPGPVDWSKREFWAGFQLYGSAGRL